MVCEDVETGITRVGVLKLSPIVTVFAQVASGMRNSVQRAQRDVRNDFFIIVVPLKLNNSDMLKFRTNLKNRTCALRDFEHFGAILGVL